MTARHGQRTLFTTSTGAARRLDRHSNGTNFASIQTAAEAAPCEQGFAHDRRVTEAYAGHVLCQHRRIVQGPRMAMVIDPGDGAYPGKFSPAAASVAGTVAAAATPARAVETDGAKLIEHARCYICHDVEKISIGPPFKAIAAMHAARKDEMIEVLARKIVDGGGGNWGVVPMVPNQWVSIEEARGTAGWIWFGGVTMNRILTVAAVMAMLAGCSPNPAPETDKAAGKGDTPVAGGK
jgi:cytochrome c